MDTMTLHSEPAAAVATGQSYERSRAYDRLRARIKSLGSPVEGLRDADKIASMVARDPKFAAAYAANQAFLKLRAFGPGAFHVDAALQNFSVMYANPGMIGDRLMPLVTVNKVSDKFFVYSKEDSFAFPSDVLAAGGMANNVDYDMDTDTYACKTYGLDGFVDVQSMANADAPLNPLADKTDYVLQGMMWRREKRIAAIMTNAANYGANTLALNPGDEWDSASGGAPVENIHYAIDNMFEGRGDTLRVGFCSINVYRVLSRHPQIRALWNTTGGGPAPGLVPREVIARFFELDDLLVGRSRERTTNKGAAAATYQRIFGDVFGVVHVAKTPGPYSLSFGQTFSFRDSNIAAVKVKFHEDRGFAGAYQVIVRTSEDHKIVAPTAGFLITNCLT